MTKGQRVSDLVKKLNAELDDIGELERKIAHSREEIGGLAFDIEAEVDYLIELLRRALRELTASNGLYTTRHSDPKAAVLDLVRVDNSALCEEIKEAVGEG